MQITEHDLIPHPWFSKRYLLSNVSGTVWEHWIVGFQFWRNVSVTLDKPKQCVANIQTQLAGERIGKDFSVWCTENWLNGRAQRAVNSSAESSSWCPPGVSTGPSLIQSLHQWPGWRDRVYPQQVCWWHKTGRTGWYTTRLCCHSARPGQAGELD